MQPLIDRRLGRRPQAAGRGRLAANAAPASTRWTAAALSLAAVLFGGANPAGAVPIDEPQVGGIGFSGPTTGDLAAVYWNPAALGLMHGLNVTIAGLARATTTSISRAAIDPATGRPLPGGTAVSPVQLSTLSQPFIWPPGPGAFAGISYDVGGDRLALAAAVYMPFADRNNYESAAGATAGNSLATRYQRISADLRNLAIVPAVAVRLAGDFRLGFAPGVLLSTGRLSFAESTCTAANPCASAEDPATDARLDLGSNQGILSSKAAITLTSGLYFKRRAWEFGFSFSSRPLGGEVGGAAVIVGDQSRVLRAPRDQTATTPAALTCNNGRTDGVGCVFADIVYRLPYMFTGAVAWHPRPGLEIAAIERILSFPSDDAIDIRLTGATLSAAGIPSHIVLYRGYGTVVDTRLRVSSWVSERVRVGAGLRYESSALPGRAVSAAAVDNRKLEPTVMVLMRPLRHLWVTAGYGFTYMFPVDTATSAFDPLAARDCAAAGGNLNDQSCLLRQNGLARGTAAGSYHQVQHDFSLSMTAQF